MEIGIEKQALFDNYLYSRLHGVNWRAGAFCVAEILERTFVFKKTQSSFVDANLLNFLEKIIGAEELRGQKLTVYLNYSTVASCVDKLIQFCDKVEVDLEMVYVTPYRVHQTSCSTCTQYSASQQHAWYTEVGL